MAQFFLTVIFLGVLWFLVLEPFLRKRKRQNLRTEPLAPALKSLAWKNVPVLKRLPPENQKELEGLINIFLAEKKFTGFEGLQITDEIRVTVAAQACLLLLNRKSSLYRSLTNIFVYPGAFRSRQERHEGSLVHEDHPVRSGESWANGPVVLAWDHAFQGGLLPHDGHNVVLHEFAHQLDQENEHTDGFPVLGGPEGYKVWAQVMEKEYQSLRSAAEKGHRTLLDHYGATNPAEFFAVATEVFFEQPKSLREDHPDLYDQLKNFYNLDMAKLAPE